MYANVYTAGAFKDEVAAASNFNILPYTHGSSVLTDLAPSSRASLVSSLGPSTKWPLSTGPQLLLYISILSFL